MVQAMASLPAILDRLIPMARRLIGFIRTLVVLTVAAVIAIVVSMAIITRPSTIGAFLTLAVFGVLLAIPPFILKLFRDALAEVIELPDWFRSAPDLMRTHGAEIAQLAARTSGDLRGSSGGGRTRLFGDVLSSGKLLLAAHNDLPEYGTALRLINLPFLFAVTVSLGVAVVEWLFAFGIMLVALVSLAFA